MYTSFKPNRSDKIRTCDPFVPNEVRYQLRYTPMQGFTRECYYNQCQTENQGCADFKKISQKRAPEML